MKNLLRYYFTYLVSPELRHVRARMGGVHSGSLIDYERTLRLVSPEIGIVIDDDWMCHFYSGKRGEGVADFVFPLDYVSGIVLSSTCVYIRLFRKHPQILAIVRGNPQVRVLEQPMSYEQLKRRMRCACGRWVLFRAWCMWCWLNIRAFCRDRVK